MRGVGRLPGLKMIDDPMNNLQINLFEGPQRLIDLALPVIFDERLSLPRSGCRIWKELQKQWVITSDSIVQLLKHLPKNRSLGVLEYNFPKAAIVFEVYFGAVAAGRFLCEPVGEVKVGWWKMTVGRLAANIIRANLSSAVSRTTAAAKGFTIEPLCGLVIVVPSLSRARSASRTGDRLTSNFCAKPTLR